MWTHLVVLRALVDVLAVHPVGRHRVPVGTRAAERAQRVVAPERAHRATLRTLVHVHTRLEQHHTINSFEVTYKMVDRNLVAPFKKRFGTIYLFITTIV